MSLFKEGRLEPPFTNGKKSPPKVQTQQFCHCPQNCQIKLSQEKWLELFDQFYQLTDQSYQNLFIQSHIFIKAVNTQINNVGPSLKRRVTCKYNIPNLQPGQTLDMFIFEAATDTIEVCQKAFMNVFGVSEKRIRVQRERCIENIIPDYYLKKSSPDFAKENQGVAKPIILHDEQPLDLSNHSERSFEMDHSQLEEFALRLGIPKDAITQDMIKKYEEMVKKNIERQKRKRRNPRDERSYATGISKKVIGLNSKAGIIPTQTLNNGDLTITPVINKTDVRNKIKTEVRNGIKTDVRSGIETEVRNGIKTEVRNGIKTEFYSGDITITPVKTEEPLPSSVQQEALLQVDSFFQNQLWQPELFETDYFSQD